MHRHRVQSPKGRWQSPPRDGPVLRLKLPRQEVSHNAEGGDFRSLGGYGDDSGALVDDSDRCVQVKHGDARVNAPPGGRV